MLGDSLFGREIIFDAFRNNYFFFFLFFFFLLFSGKNCGDVEDQLAIYTTPRSNAIIKC